ncbi:transmembrane protein 14 homolog [Sycon ciliatum]|uniref:transmembrane protein 14 homolog n=1 Tax=Sycon ciliatum TaxID=27933 RepID=UPI0020AB3F02|eukprot:scpid90420/ scgid17802/ UPF0136 membrane protein CG5532
MPLAPSPDYVTYTIGTLVAAGGIFGYVKAASLMSLGSGLVFGSLIIYGGVLHSTNRRDFLLAFLASLTLSGIMVFRLVKTGKIMPAAPILALNLFQVVRFTYRFLTD